ncbi:hypothetical protein CLAIMM_13688 [Cladophialophora immunda]|nr:hypothetical protein CLAIMM_13688 [Cladophialophora immunda]
MDMDDVNISPSNHKATYDMHHDDYDRDEALRKIRTAGSISITPELFEKIYLSPANRVSNNLRSTLGNPTPLGVYYFFGGLLMMIGSILEFILGNTFPFVVFGSFGAFWLSWAATLTPYYNASIAYDPGDPTASATNPTFASTFAFFHLYMAVLVFIYLICSLRTNICFVLIFVALVPALCLMAASFWKLAEGNVKTAVTCQHAAAGLLFAVCLLGWYLLAAQMLASVDFPLNLPVGDLSSVIKGASTRAAARQQNAESKED